VHTRAPREIAVSHASGNQKLFDSNRETIDKNFKQIKKEESLSEQMNYYRLRFIGISSEGKHAKQRYVRN